MFDFQEIRELYGESRVGNAHVHAGRFFAAFVVVSATWGLGLVAFGALVGLSIGDIETVGDVATFILFGMLGGWLPAAAWTSYLAGRGGEA